MVTVTVTMTEDTVIAVEDDRPHELVTPVLEDATPQAPDAANNLFATGLPRDMVLA